MPHTSLGRARNKAEKQLEAMAWASSRGARYGREHRAPRLAVAARVAAQCGC